MTAQAPAPAPVPAARRGVLRRVFRRRPWETLATVLVAAGVLMLMQPFSLALYGWSLSASLVGVVLFLFVSKFPD